MFSGHLEACGGPGRGVCEQIPEVRLQYWPAPPEEFDDRVNWPHFYVHQGCRCLGNFYGADCSKCKFGFSGRDCNEKSEKLVRRNILDYSPREKQIFQQTVLRSKYISSGLGVVLPPDNSTNTTGIRMVALSIYDTFQYLHYRTSHGTVDQCQGINFAHGGAAFPTWHRRYMLWIERELRTISNDPSFTLPYWDWIDDENCTVCTNDLVGAVNRTGNDTLEKESPFAEWDTRCAAEDRCGTCDPTISSGPILRAENSGPLPTSEKIETMLKNDIYDVFDSSVPPRGFREDLEIPHNQVSIMYRP